MEDGKMVLEEIHRFPHGMKEKDGHKCWDTEALFSAIVEGMKKCKEVGKIPVSMGIDTWAVDFVLLDKEDRMIGNAVGYRDSRTAGMDKKVYEIIPEESLYGRTGIQKQIGPLLQGTHKYGVILIVLGQRCNVRSAVFQLEVGVGEACEIYNRLCG